ncbi:mpv17-like protein [Musca domestica]|uniref:Mitochondrial inner membrane protein Mpv17 n=1 Tax=Musca domestica TaxID=7370 RepID=A0ABM3VJ80_MUSDO|nr:mpv17-like protein [Musca domestica]
MASNIRFLRPYVSEGLRAAGIMGAGDILAQTVVEKKSFKDIDLIRTAKYGSLGMLFVGPVLKYWFGLLDRQIRGKQGVQRALKKMAVDQAIMAPSLNLAIASLVGLINNEKPGDIAERLKTQYPDIMKTNYIIWPAVQILNFGLVPLRYQVVFVQTIAVFWNCFVSQRLNEKLADKTPQLMDEQEKSL